MNTILNFTEGKFRKTKLALFSALAMLAMAGITASAESYTVQSGDTLSKIAQNHETTVDQLASINSISNVNLIYAGEVLELDAASATSTNTGATTNTAQTTQTTNAAATTNTSAATSTSGSVVLSNGNTAGSVGTSAAAQVAAATGTSQSTWEYIIAKESNGNVNAYNASGASGLFQTMPGWGDTSTVSGQVQAAINAYNAQGFSAWGM